MRIESWGPDDIALLRRCVGDPAMMEHLGGPETEAKIAERQARYERLRPTQFKIIVEDSGEGVGWVGYWDRDWHGQRVFEIGWAVVPEHQRRGIAAAATELALDKARREHTRRSVYAYPAVCNGPSNAICRRLGFELLGTEEFEFPKGAVLTSNVWRLELWDTAAPDPAS